MSRPDSGRLSQAEARFVDATAEGVGVTEAARLAGVSKATGVRWRRRAEIRAAVEARRAEAEDVAGGVREELAKARAHALRGLAKDVPALVAELRRRAFCERGSAGVRAGLELLKLAGFADGIEDEQGEDGDQGAPRPAITTDEEAAARYVELLGEAALREDRGRRRGRR